jgi:hypothetical protein
VEDQGHGVQIGVQIGVIGAVRDKGGEAYFGGLTTRRSFSLDVRHIWELFCLDSCHYGAVTLISGFDKLRRTPNQSQSR